MNVHDLLFRRLALSARGATFIQDFSQSASKSIDVLFVAGKRQNIMLAN